jgi:xylitol oxidase
MSERLTNWAGNITYGAQRVLTPTSVEQAQQLVAGSDRVRALGTRHSFNRLADTDDDLISLAGLPPRIDVDPERSTVTVSSGVRYGEAARPLHAAGYALHNLGSLPHISVAGACASGTHGSGVSNGNLSTAVRGLELITADGELTTITRDDDFFSGAVIGLGALGVVTAVTLDVEPTFDMRQYVYENLAFERLAESFDEVLASGYSVSLFTDWRARIFNQVWRKRRISAGDPADAPPSWLGATLADGPRHPVPGVDPVNCTAQQGVRGPWHERLPHFRLDFTPSSGSELQTEYFVDRRDAVAAIDAVAELREQLAPVLQITEIRTIAADELWMSPCHGRDSVAIHFTWFDDTAAVLPVVTAVEAVLAPFAARPHWGKVFTVGPEAVASYYERFPDFLRLLAERDPGGKFRNAMIDRYFPVGGAFSGA